MKITLKQLRALIREVHTSTIPAPTVAAPSNNDVDDNDSDEAFELPPESQEQKFDRLTGYKLPHVQKDDPEKAYSMLKPGKLARRSPSLPSFMAQYLDTSKK